MKQFKVLKINKDTTSHTIVVLCPNCGYKTRIEFVDKDTMYPCGACTYKYKIDLSNQ